MRSRNYVYMWVDTQERPSQSLRQLEEFERQLEKLSGTSSYFQMLYRKMAEWMEDDRRAWEIERCFTLFQRLITSGMDLMAYAGTLRQEGLLLIGSLVDLRINEKWRCTHFYQLVLKLIKAALETKNFLSEGLKEKLLTKYKQRFPENYFRYFIVHDFST